MATPRTGNPPGRPKGRKNNKTLEREREAAKALQRAKEQIEAQRDEAIWESEDPLDALTGVHLSELRGMDSHAVLVAVYRNPVAPVGARIDCAKAALKFEKPTIAAVQAAQTGTMSHVEATRRAELVEKLRAHMAKILGREPHRPADQH
jgi:hypothetical protein